MHPVIDATSGPWARRRAAQPLDETTLRIPAGTAALDATLRLPGRAHGLVVFAHASVSTRFSAHNRQLASRLNDFGLATLLFDLLAAGEQQLGAGTTALRFDIELLTERLTGVVDWLATAPATCRLPCGLFGAGTGAAAALDAAAARPQRVAAVVSRGGRPDFAQSLSLVHAPTLLIVGELDRDVLRLNREAAARLACEHQIEIVPGASHLFAEAGMLDAVTKLASGWLDRHLRSAHARLRTAAALPA